MKLLLVGPSFFRYNESWARAFAELGITVKILSFFEYPSKPIPYIGLRLGSRVLAGKYDPGGFNRRLIATLSEFKPDILFVIKGTFIHPKTLKKLKENDKNIVTILWMTDRATRFPSVLEEAKYYDIFYSYEPRDVSDLRGMGIAARFLPQAFDPIVYQPLSSIENQMKDTFDIFFVGSGGLPNRDLFLKELVGIAKKRKRNLGIYGKYWNPYNPFTVYRYRVKQRELCKYIHNFHLDHSQINEFYNLSKISLNIHKPQAVEGLNPRTFEILGAGGFELVDYKKTMEDLFDIDKELVCYRGIEELVEKIIYYIDHDKERSIIAKAGHQRVLKEHTIKHRVERILTDIARL